MGTVLETYDYLFKEIADPRVANWFLLSTPWGVFSIIGLYLFAVYVYLPTFMEYRKPFNLSTAIRVYNIYQVLSCSLLIYGVATSGWTTYYTLGCQPADFSESKLGMRMINMMWWHFMLKMSELIETVFFVLRKKYSQVTFLHVYHHISTLLFAWVACKYWGGGMITFTVLVNSFVHILMYTYYLLASLGPSMQRKLAKIKPKLTIIQMIQFCLLIAHTSQVFSKDCPVPKLAGLIFIPNVLINFTFFYKFYTSTYNKEKLK